MRTEIIRAVGDTEDHPWHDPRTSVQTGRGKAAQREAAQRQRRRRLLITALISLVVIEARFAWQRGGGRVGFGVARLGLENGDQFAVRW